MHPGSRAPRSFLAAPGTYNWNADPDGMAFLLQAYHYGVHRLIGFANSAPPFFTSNGADCGGSLKPASVGAYTTYLATVASHLRTAYGIHLAAVSPMNEPTNDFAACNQEGMAVPPARRSSVITSLAGALAARSPGTAVSADESTTSAALRSGIDRWIDPDVRSVAFHGYDYPTAAALRSLHGMVRARTSSQIEMSEVCCSTGAGFARGYNPGILNGLWLANTMWRDLVGGRGLELQLVDGAVAQDRVHARHRRQPARTCPTPKAGTTACSTTTPTSRRTETRRSTSPAATGCSGTSAATSDRAPCTTRSPASRPART